MWCTCCDWWWNSSVGRNHHHPILIKYLTMNATNVMCGFLWRNRKWIGWVRSVCESWHLSSKMFSRLHLTMQVRVIIVAVWEFYPPVRVAPCGHYMHCVFCLVRCHVSWLTPLMCVGYCVGDLNVRNFTFCTQIKCSVNLTTGGGHLWN